MTKKALFILIVLCVGALNSFAEIHEDDTNNTLYISNIHFNSATQATITVSLRNTAEIGGFQFDLLLPEGFTVKHTTNRKGEAIPTANLVEERTDHTVHTFNSSFPETDNFSHVRLLCFSASDYTFEDNDGPVAQIAIDIASTVAGGIHSASMGNVVVSNANANDTYEMAVIPVNLYALSADNIMPIGADVKALDLTTVTGLPEGTTIQTANPNTLIFTATDQKLSNTSNVVIGSECHNLVLTDGYSFDCPTPFTANQATYSRTMTNKWGTIVLPYDVESTSDVAYYLPEKIENNALVLVRQEQLAANTPAIVAKLNGNGITCSNTSVTVQTALSDKASGSTTMHGSYTMNTTVTNSDAFYIKDNKFWRCNEEFHADAFRAYFTTDVPSAAKSLTILCSDETNGIAESNANNGAEVTDCYDITGKRHSDLQNGINIVKLSNGDTKKIILK